MAKLTYDSAVNELKTHKRQISRINLIGILENLGFDVHSGSSGNYYTFTHSFLTDFHGGSFDGQHSKDAIIKFPYILKIIATLQKYEDEIREYKKETI